MRNRFSSVLFCGLCLVLAVMFANSGQISAAPLGLPDLAAEETNAVSAELKAAAEDFQQGKFDDAILKIEALRAKDPNISPAQLVLASWFAQVNQIRAMRQMVEICVTKHPDDPEAYVVLADLNLQNGSITEAELLYGKTKETVAKYTASDTRRKNLIRRYQIGMAQINAARGKKTEAVANLDVLLKAEPDNIGAWNLLGTIQFEDGKIDKAVEAFAKAKALDGKNLQAEARVAMLYQAKGNKQEAAKYMAAAIQAAKQDMGVRLAAAQWSLQTGNIKQAVEQAQAALILEPDSPDAQFARGIVALHAKDYVTAETNFGKILAGSPSNFAATNYLALALCEQNDPTKLKKAEEYALVNARVQNPPAEAFATAAWVLFKKGDTANAQQFLQNAIRVANGQISPDMGYYIAAINAKSGSPDAQKQAKEILSKILESTTPFYMRADAEKLQKELP